jgi:hypothetical protein
MKGTYVENELKLLEGEEVWGVKSPIRIKG